MMIKKILSSIILSCLFFVAVSVFSTGVSAADKIYFDPSSINTTKDTNFQVDVKIDVGSVQIFGADAVINYPSDDLTVKSITYGGFFSDHIAPIQSTGQIILRGSFFNSISGSGSGSGTFATLVFTTNKNSGTGSIAFKCSGGGSITDIIDTGGINILTCALSPVSLNYASTSTTTTTTTTTTGNGPTNACGGTCGSVYNCNVNLFCYQGYCRNPDCPNEAACGCPTATPAPTVKPVSKTSTTKKGTKATPTSDIGTLTKYTPPPPYIPEPTLPAEVATEEAKGGDGLDAKTIGIIVGAIALGIGGIFLIVSRMKGGKPPKFTPPTGPGFNSPPMGPPSTPPPSF
jgi:hypothetical protein